MVSSLDTLDPVTAVQMESLEHQSTSEHYSQDYGVQEPDSDTERLVSELLDTFTTRELAVKSKLLLKILCHYYIIIIIKISKAFFNFV